MRRVLGSLLVLLVAATGITPTRAGDDDIHIVGIVLDPAGKPFASVQVLAYSATTLADFSARRGLDPTLDLPQPDGNGTTGRDGRFRIATSAAGLYALRVDPPGTARAVLGGVPAARGDVPSVVVKTEAPTSLEGTFVDSAGKPVAGARVSVVAGVGSASGDPAERTLRTYGVQTDASGRWVVHGVRPAAATIDHVAVQPDSARPVWYSYSLGSTPAKEPIALGGTASVRFRLVDPHGNPIAGRIATDVMTRGVNAWFLVSTGVDGTAVVEGLPAGKMGLPLAASKRMRNRDVDLMEAIETTIELVAAKQLEHEIRLAPKRSLDGTVVDDQGKPIAGAMVRPPQSDLDLPVATSDAQGRFRLENVRRLDGAEAHAAGYVSARENSGHTTRLSDTDGRLVVRLTRFGEVAGRVLTPEGKPAVGWIVQWGNVGLDLQDLITYTVTGEDGRFLHPTAIAGAFMLTTRGQDLVFGDASATVVAGKRTEGLTVQTKRR